MVCASLASVLASPVNAPLIRLTSRPGTDRTGCPVAISSVTSSAADPEVMSSAHTTSPSLASAPALVVVRVISSSIATCRFLIFRENTVFPSASTAHAWWNCLPTSIPTHNFLPATRQRLLFSQLSSPRTTPPAAP